MKASVAILCFYLGLSDFYLNPVVSVVHTYPDRLPVGRLRMPTRNVCPPISIKNGLAKRRSARSRVVRFFCNRGYLLAGEKHSTCVRNTWDPQPPRCVRPTCKTISQINNDNLLVYPTHSKAVQHFFCKADYKLNGPAVIYCDGNKWSDNVPTCIHVDKKPKLNCDFETTDLCGWTQDLNHDFDWTRENFNTPSGSIGTGPSFDHTKGAGKNGYYMYIESSSRTENDTARLISPVYEKIDSEVCFEFYYHMFGTTIGTLRVYLKPINDSWVLTPESAFFSKSGNQGDKWYRSFHHLGPINSEFQIIIEGVRGAGYISDIAIDDVRIIPNCTDEEESTTMESSTYNEVIPIVDSCENRCGQTEPITHDDYHLTCDCDEECFNNNRCCPDYYDACVFLGNSVTVTDDFDTVMSGEEVGTTLKMDKTSISNNITKIVEDSVTTAKVILSKSTQPINLTKSTTVKLTTVTTRTTKMSSKYTRPIIHIQTPPPNPVIYRKVLTTTKPITFTKSDVIDVPRPTDIDEGTKEFLFDELENSVDAVFNRNFNESNKLFSQSSVKEANSHFLILGVSITVVVILISIVVVYAIRKFRFSKSMWSSSSQSQSDVRYLTRSDDLDLSLPDSYDQC